jgi:hypothetical protein
MFSQCWRARHGDSLPMIPFLRGCTKRRCSNPLQRSRRIVLHCANGRFYSHLLEATRIPSCTDTPQSALFLSCIVMQDL